MESVRDAAKSVIPETVWRSVVMEQYGKLKKECSIFKDFDESEFAILIDASEEINVSAGEIVYRQLDFADEFFIVLDGTFVPYYEKPVSLQTEGSKENVSDVIFEKNDVIGWTCAQEWDSDEIPNVRLHSVRASSERDTAHRLLRIPREAWMNWFEIHGDSFKWDDYKRQAKRGFSDIHKEALFAKYKERKAKQIADKQNAQRAALQKEGTKPHVANDLAELKKMRKAEESAIETMLKEFRIEQEKTKKLLKDIADKNRTFKAGPLSVDLKGSDKESDQWAVSVAVQ